MYAIAVLLGLMIVLPAQAEEQLIPIETDIEAKYFVVARSGNNEQQILLLKRVRPGNTTYSKRLFDCEARAYQHQGSWGSLEEMKGATCPEMGMRPIEQGTIAYQLWQYACDDADTPANSLQ